MVSLEEELWRHAVRQPRDQASPIRELVVVCKPLPEGDDAPDVSDVLCSLSPLPLGHTSTNFGVSHLYYSSESTKSSFKADTVVVRQNYSRWHCTDLVTSIENAVRRLYLEGSECRFCEKPLKHLTSHLCRACNHLKPHARSDNPRTIAIAVENVLKTLTMPQLFVHSGVLPRDCSELYDSFPLEAFERIASLSYDSKCPFRCVMILRQDSGQLSLGA